MALRTSLPLLSGLLVLVASIASAQTTIQTYHKTPWQGMANGGLAGGSDVDKDGVPDVVGGWGVDWSSPGLAVVLSGATGAELFALPGEWFGPPVDFAGDVDGDTWPDVIVGDAAQGSTTPGFAHVYSGRDGSVLFTFAGDGVQDQFGCSVAGAGDVNADGHPDVIVGAIASESALALSNQGLARVFSGLDGGILYSFYGDAVSDTLGESVTTLGDVDGDGHDDVAATASCIDYHGSKPSYVRIYSGATGATLHTLVADAGGDGFGRQIRGIGDVDHDGAGDLAVSVGAATTPKIKVFSGASGALLANLIGPGNLVGAAGDVDGDGYPDVIAADNGTTRLWSGKDWSVMFDIPVVGWGAGANHAVAGGGDIDGDGYGDLLVQRAHDAGFPNSPGSIHAYSSRLLPPTVYCTSKINSQGCQAAMASIGTPSISSVQPFTVFAAQAINNKSGLLFYSVDARASTQPFGTLCVTGGKIKRTSVQNSGGNPPPDDCSGVLTFEFNALIQSGTDDTLVPNQTIYAQYWYRDPVAASPSATSDALRFTIGL